MYKVIVDHNPSQSDNEVVKEGLIRSYEAQFGERDKELSIFLKSDSGKVFGGIQAMFDSEAIYIEALWIEENLRKQGYGKKLLAAAEREAIENGCRFSLVDTWDFQAEEFYLKNGYEKIGELKNYWHGHSKLFLRKKLHLDICNATCDDENIHKIKSLAAGHKNKNKHKQHPLIRPLCKTDIPQIVSRYSFPWSTPEQTQTLWNTYYQEQQDRVRTVAVIEENSEILGYGSLLRKPECPFFAQRNIPEVNAVWIDQDHRRKGLGTALIHWLENLAKQEGYSQIGIGVGLYGDYGPAQQLYFQLGYTPEGNGITYKGEATVAGQSYPLDDDLILWLVKPLIKTKRTQ